MSELEDIVSNVILVEYSNQWLLYIQLCIEFNQICNRVEIIMLVCTTYYVGVFHYTQ